MYKPIVDMTRSGNIIEILLDGDEGKNRILGQNPTSKNKKIDIVKI